jgi:hypothetical protein
VGEPQSDVQALAVRSRSEKRFELVARRELTRLKSSYIGNQLKRLKVKRHWMREAHSFAP